MMLLGFYAGSTSYCISIDYVSEVIPSVDIEPLDRSIPGFLGIFDFRGSSLPVFDLRLAHDGVNSVEALSTRIIILEWADYSVGLRAERVTELFEEDALTSVEREIPMLVTPEAIIPEAVYKKSPL
jgi:chemotaxis-related protein WspB